MWGQWLDSGDGHMCATPLNCMYTYQGLRCRVSCQAYLTTTERDKAGLTQAVLETLEETEPAGRVAASGEGRKPRALGPGGTGQKMGTSQRKGVCVGRGTHERMGAECKVLGDSQVRSGLGEGLS